VAEPVPVRVFGLGNPLRGDDAVGLAVAEALRADPPAGARVQAFTLGPLDLAEQWGPADIVFLVDALDAALAPGTWRRFEATHAALPLRTAPASTHALDLAGAIELARELGRLPARLVVYGIAGKEFGVGRGLTPRVRAAVAEVTRRIRDEIRALGSSTSG
jgi:hydrogenase maturation protease